MESRFKQYATLLIDNIEGGYYHPNMKAKLVNGNRMLDSGETMYGMDRKAGGTDINDSSAGKKFWKILDDNNASTKWKYGYKAEGQIAKNLKDLAGEMMYNRYKRYSDMYLKGNKKIVSQDTRLELHFFYACWNGVDWFKRFANELNNEIAQQKQNGKIDYDKLADFVIQSRTNSGNSLIRDGASKVKKIFGLDAFKKIKIHNNTWLWITLGIAVVGGGIGLYMYKRKGKNMKKWIKG
ncbi:MAG: hypothetical protein IJ150_03695 [Bacteroidales bacterium]|nr:hypothetical protein [Bacteroidales bacterium]